MHVAEPEVIQWHCLDFNVAYDGFFICFRSVNDINNNERSFWFTFRSRTTANIEISLQKNNRKLLKVIY